jgi:mannosyltransferase
VTSGLRSRSAQVVVALTVLAAALRFGTLDVQSAWLDEAATIDLVHRGLKGMLSHLSVSESTPPLYYILVWAWSKVFGAGVLGLRSFSALMGTLTIPVVYLAGRRISTRVGLWAAALACVNPAMYYYSQEARSYALFILLCAVAFLLWEKALQEGDGRSLAWWALASILALLTHYFAVFLFIGEALTLLRRHGLRRAAAPIGAVLLAGLALLPLAVSQRASGQASWIEGTSLASRAGAAAKQFLVGVYGPQEIITALLAGLLALGALALLLYRSESRERERASEIALVGIAALGLPLLLSLTHMLDVFDGRNVIASWTPWVLLLAIGLGVSRAPRLAAVVGASLCALSLLVVIALDSSPAYQRDNWRGVARALPAHPLASVVVTPSNGLLPLSVYLPGLRKDTAPRVAAREIDFVSLRVRRTGHAPSPAVVPSTPPAGFHLVEVTRTATFALARFVASHRVEARSGALRGMTTDAASEVLTRR